MPKNKAGGRRRETTPLCVVTVGQKKSGLLLGKRAKRVKGKDWNSVKALSEGMLQVLRKARGQGISAPQVGSCLAVSVIETRKTKGRRRVKASKALVMVNPKIKRRSQETVAGWEGCLSLHDGESHCVLRARVERYRSVTVKFWDVEGKKHCQRLTGFLARVVQHELDHLAGILFLQRVNWQGNVARKLKLETL
jgi:peptide deformylase